MKLFQFYTSENQIQTGFVKNGEHFAFPIEITMDDLLGKSQQEVLLFIEEKQTISLRKDEINFAPVVTHPEKILCIGLNYQDHIDETGANDAVKPGFPPVFPKFANSLLGHKQPLQLPKKAKKFDYETELVIIMGKECKSVSKDEALSYVGGYTVGNDFSARDMQFASSQWTMGKAGDGFAPIGPYLVKEEGFDPQNLNLSCQVNGKIVQKANTSQMIYSCAEIISYLSDFITLKKGDVIFTGTPSGVILGKAEDEQVWLQAGDRMMVEIEGISRLENELV